MQSSFNQDLAKLNSAESFLRYFDVPFDPGLIATKPLLFMRLFKLELNEFGEPWSYRQYRQALKQAHCKLSAGLLPSPAASACGSCTACGD